VLDKEGRNRPDRKREFSRPVALGVSVADTWPLEVSYGDATVEEHSGSVAVSWESASVGRRPAVQPPHPYEIVAGAIGPELRSRVPTPCLKLRFDEDGGSRAVEVLFVDSLAFRWQDGVAIDHYERDDQPYEVINSAWLAEYERWDELERDTSSYRHFRINFNERSGGYLEVLCRAVLLHRPASR
jgi:hypothetical protein